MAKAAGVVEIVAVKGNATNAKIAGVWYGCGFQFKGEFAQGDNIEFEYSEKGQYKNVVLSSVRKVAGAAPAPVAQGNFGAARAAADLTRQRSITYQASRNAAIEVAQIAVQAGILNLGKKEAEKLDHLLNFIEDLTAKYFDRTEAVGEGADPSTGVADKPDFSE